MAVSAIADVVVAGSGAGGAAAAWRLTSGGLRVLLLEAGPRFDPATDYPQTEPGWERRAIPVKPGSRGAVTYGDLGQVPHGYDDLASWSRGGLPGRLRAGDRRSVGEGYSHVQGVGGTTLHFVGEAHRLHPDAFAADWPIAYGDLEPYYAIAEDVLGVACDGDGADRWRSTPWPQSAHPVSPGGREIMRAGGRAGQNWQINPRAVLSAGRPGRPPCNYCGVCSRGCPLGDKGSADVTWLRDAAATGNLTVWADTPVTRLVAGANGEIAAVEVIREGRAERIETPRLVLAAGAVQTPRLLLASADARTPDGVANGSGQVGRNFMETLSWRSTGLVPGLSGSHLGLPADVVWWGPANGFRLTHSTLDAGFNGPVGYAGRLIGGFGAELKQAIRSNFGSALSIGAVGRVAADERSAVTLDPQVRDANGVSAARVSSVLTRESLELLREMAGAARAVLAEAGAEIVEEAGSADGLVATHVFGTARMGGDSGSSVVDPFGRSHDHANLWIADTSVFPGTGGGEAPSLTASALAVRTADAIMRG